MKNRLLEWYRLRKKSVIAHWLFGALCAYVAIKYFPAALAMMGMFAGFEVWNDKCDRSRQGAMDWWDALVIFTVGLGVILILDAISLVTIRWI